MAFAAKAAASVSYEFLDASGSRASMSLSLPYATTVADANAKADALRALVAAVTGCAIVSQSVTFTQVETAIPAAAIGSRVERKAVLQFATDAAKFVTYELPSPVDGIVLENGRIDEDQADLAALITAITDVTDPRWSDSNGQALIGLRQAYERYNSSTPRMLPSQRNPDADSDPG